MKKNIVEVKVENGTNEILQHAVDSIYKSGGGSIMIGPGIFEMQDSLHLKTGVKIYGTQGRTVLKKSRCVSSDLSADLGYGHYDVSVKRPDLFNVGMGIHIIDDSGRGFYGTVATITWKDGDKLGIDKMLNHDYARIRHARVSTEFPVISGYYVRDALVQGITIEGNKDENDFIDGCRGGGIFLLQCHGVNLSNILVEKYAGDGISYQQCTRLLIENCEIRNNSGSGLHPGSGSTGVIMRNCKIIKNDNDGVFYCLRVGFTLLENCEISNNGNDGISIGARDTDHIIRENTITDNARHAIYFRKADEVMGGHRNLIEGNIISENCRKIGMGEVFIENVNCDIWFRKNQITCGKKSKYGIVANNLCKRICIAKDNSFVCCKKEKMPSIKSGIFEEVIPKKLSVGPEYVNNNSIRHLGILEE